MYQLLEEFPQAVLPALVGLLRQGEILFAVERETLDDPAGFFGLRV